MKPLLALAIGGVLLYMAATNDQWRCHVHENRTMLSMSDSGKIAGASKACSCAEMVAFNYKLFGGDINDIRADIGC